jgi:preprotein translocase subunit SecG
MVILFVALLMLACIFLGLIVLIQNPKGGGLAGNVAGFSNQFMGVKQTTDVLEKGTWTLAIVVGVLCLFSALFIPRATANQGRDIKPTVQQQTVPSQPQLPKK